MKFDVCIPTFNSSKTLEYSLEAIKRNIPYNRIIICDGYSSDNTIKIAKKYGCEIHFCKGKLGKARNILMKLAKTEWFFFIDSDVVVNKKWFKIILNSIDKSTGAINGFALPKNFLLSNFRKYMLLFKIGVGLQQRGFTSNTLIRKDAVRGIKLPDLKRLEDIVLQEKIKKGGWEWKFTPAFCLHLKSASQVLKEAKQDFFYLVKKGDLLKAASRL